MRTHEFRWRGDPHPPTLCECGKHEAHAIHHGPVRELRGSIYLARAKLRRLSGYTKRELRDERNHLAMLLRRARKEGVSP